LLKLHFVAVYFLGKTLYTKFYGDLTYRRRLFADSVSIVVLMQARRALRALRGLVRLRLLVDGNSVKRQAASTLRCMQTLARVQSQIRSRRLKMSEENQALQRQLLLKQELESLRVGNHLKVFSKNIKVF
jgi:hypothetical protein